MMWFDAQYVVIIAQLCGNNKNAIKNITKEIVLLLKI